VTLPIAACQREGSGERAAFERIMQEGERRVLRIALGLLRNRQDAQDAAALVTVLSGLFDEVSEPRAKLGAFFALQVA